MFYYPVYSPYVLPYGGYYPAYPYYGYGGLWGGRRWGGRRWGGRRWGRRF